MVVSNAWQPEKPEPRSQIARIPVEVPARALLALLRTVGVYPATGGTALAGTGLYGSWLTRGANHLPLPDDEDVLAVGLNRAVALVDARRG